MAAFVLVASVCPPFLGGLEGPSQAAPRLAGDSLGTVLVGSTEFIKGGNISQGDDPSSVL